MLRETLRQLGVSDVNMEEGSLRCDANVSIRPAGSSELGVKTELNNMNSFRFLAQGIAAEVERQVALLEAGDRVVQETLHFDPVTGRLSPLRSKEEAHDYRYFPEPDLVPLAPTEAMLREARAALPELPAARIARYEAMGVPTDTATLLAGAPAVAELFEETVRVVTGVEPRVAANWITGELTATLRKRGLREDWAERPVDSASFARVMELVEAKRISHAGGKEVLEILVVEGGGEPDAIVEREGLAQMSDSGELEAIVERAMADNADAVEKIREGNGKAIGAIVGAVMRETKGRADGGEVNRLIQERL
jgi:aspartyl-tRNA(Asn)/glutamyl-tRNA(Gln) amidotransferase subunit B